MRRQGGARPSITLAGADLAAEPAALHSGVCLMADWPQLRSDLKRSGARWMALPCLNRAGERFATAVIADRPLDGLEGARTHDLPEERECPATVIACWAFHALARAGEACPRWAGLEG